MEENVPTTEIVPVTPIKVPVAAIIATLVLVAEIGLFAVYQYQQYAQSVQESRLANAVLGAKSSASCVPANSVKKALKDKNRTVTLYAPDKTYTFPLESIASCVQFSGCSTEGVSCRDVSTNIEFSCISTYLKNNPGIATTRKVITGEGATVQVRVQDWSIETEALASQLKDAMTKEVSYCDVSGEKEVRSNIGNIQLSVTNTVPGIEENFAPRFVEVDKSRAQVYLWKDGSFKTFAMKTGARSLHEGIYLVGKSKLGDILQSKEDANFVSSNTQGSDYIVIHD